MALQYTEFRTTGQALLYDLTTAIAVCTDWTKQNSTAVVLTTSGSTSIGGTSLPFTATGSSGWAIGKVIRIGAAGATDTEYRKITAISGTTITVAAMSFAHPSGTNVYDGAEVWKATTTRGADMVVDFADDVPDLQTMYLAAYRTYLGDKSRRMNLYYKDSGSGTFVTNPLYVTLSVSKEHLFVAIEGPKGVDVAGQDNGTNGSFKGYFFINDLVPYFSSGIDPNPTVVCGGTYNNTPVSTFVNQSEKVLVGRNIANNQSWGGGPLQVLEWPAHNPRTTDGAPSVVQRLSPDGNYYLSPYVFFDDNEGLRGRLGNIFYAGMGQNGANTLAPLMPGMIVTYGGVKYKLIIPNKNPNHSIGYQFWGPLGMVANNADRNSWFLIAVPCL